ncbi:flagellar hook-length control protein FliK [Halochromatium salexigens]|nr:flagellar hook-length control protein FliK [Halochromatium salexigens]
MHQVLGKRVDTQQPRDLNPPVKPMSPADAPSAVRSDSRLDARSNPPITQTGRAAAREAPYTQARQPGGERQPTPSAQVNFTPTARSIADLLLRFPATATASAVRVTQPLFPSNAQPAPAQVAEHLQTTVRESGLFYESHLARWYRGGFSREQLQREPQMWRPLASSQAARQTAQAPTATPPGQAGQAGQQATQAPTAMPPQTSLPAFVLGLSRAAEPLPGLGQGKGPVAMGAAATPGSGTAASAATGAPSTSFPGQATTSMPGTAASLAATAARDGSMQQQAQVASAEMAALRSAPLQRGGEPIHESLQGLVRHQLELLATPVLRWEGDVWSGIFMALMIQPPPRRDDGREPAGEEAAEQEDDADKEWHSSMMLRVNGLGEVKVKLWLSESRLDLELSTADAEVRAALARGIDRLRLRLEAHALSEVEIRLRSLEPESAPAPPPAADAEARA